MAQAFGQFCEAAPDLRNVHGFGSTGKLRTRCERPRGRSAEKRDELAPLHTRY